MKSTEKTLVDELVADIRKKAEQSSPDEQQRLRAYALAMEQRQQWDHVETWAGLFKLYRKPDGQMVAEMDEPLLERHSRLQQGVSESEQGLAAVMTAFEAIALAASSPPVTLPDISDIPPMKHTASGIGNAREIHEAAVRMFLNAVPARTVFKMLQESLASQITRLTEGSSESRLATAKELKKDFCKAIDSFAQPFNGPSLSHGNTRKTQGVLRAELIAVRVIEAARQLVEEHQRLPTKYAVRERLAKIDPDSSEISISSWNRLLKESGLAGLPKDKPWRK